MVNPSSTPAPPSGEKTSKGVRSSTFFERLRRHFLAGLLVIIPAFVAVYAVFVIMNTADRLFGGIVQSVMETFLPSELANKTYVEAIRAFVSFLLASILVFFIGYISTFFIVRRAIGWGEAVVGRLPLIKFFYYTPKEVLSTFTSANKQAFKRVVLIEYPRRGIWCLGFATGEVVKQPDETPLVAIFLPTTPNPTSGFLLLIPKQDVHDTNIPVEDGARLIISGGLLAPAHIYAQRFAGLEQIPTLPPLEPLRASTEIATLDDEDMADEQNSKGVES